MTEWYDIKDAPRDGTEIASYIQTDTYQGYEIIKFSKGTKLITDYNWRNSYGNNYTANEIKGWMPLPEPPKKKHCCICYTSICREDEEGRFWVEMGGLRSQIKYCPFCGEPAEKEHE